MRKANQLEELLTRYIPEPNSGCWLWLGKVNTDGYGEARFQHRLLRMHRLYYEQHNGEIPVGHVVRHKCDVRSCVNPDHLITGTHKDNMQDMVSRGRSPRNRGELNGRAKITQATADAIRSGVGSYRDLAKQYGTSKSNVYRIKRGFNWAEQGMDWR